MEFDEHAQKKASSADPNVALGFLLCVPTTGFFKPKVTCIAMERGEGWGTAGSR